MAEFALKYSTAPLRQAKAIQFGVIAPDQMKSLSVLTADERDGRRVDPGVTTPATYDYITGEPVIGGLSDPRFGPEDLDDPGYFGHIELARPVFHIGFMNIIIHVLRCVGYHTHKLLVEEKDTKAVKEAQRWKGRRRLHEMMKICENR